MKLVKDYINDCTVYYWISNPETHEPVSPQFRSFAQAEEWWKECMFSKVEAPQRRRDNRTTQKQYQNSPEAQAVPDASLRDMAVKVDLDLHKDKTE